MAAGLAWTYQGLGLVLPVSILVSNIPQVRVAWKEASLEDLSLGTWLLSMSDGLVWGLYAIIQQDRSIMVFAVFQLVTSLGHCPAQVPETLPSARPPARLERAPKKRLGDGIVTTDRVYSNIFSSAASASTASGSMSRIRSFPLVFQYSLYHSLAMIMAMTSLVPVQMEARRKSLTIRSTG